MVDRHVQRDGQLAHAHGDRIDRRRLLQDPGEVTLTPSWMASASALLQATSVFHTERPFAPVTSVWVSLGEVGDRSV